MDIASLKLTVDSRDVKRGESDLRDLAKTGASAEKQLTGSTKRVNDGFDSMKRFIKQASAALAAIKSVQVFVKMADEVGQLNARLRLVTSSAQDFAAVQQRITDLSNKNYQSLSATTSLYVKLTPALKALGKSSEDTLQVVDAFGKALRVGGAGAGEAASATLQFSQALASGVLRGDEFNSIAEASPRILQAIAAGSGYAAKELRALAADGVLSAELVSNALQSQLGVLTSEADKIPSTVGGAIQVFQNQMLMAVGSLNEAASVTELLKTALGGLSSIVQSLAATIVPAFETINRVITTTDGTIGAVKDTLKIAAGAAAGFVFAMNIGPIVGVATIALTGLVAQVQMATVGMSLATLATGAFKAALTALMANPAILVFATIGAGIAYVNSEYDKMNRKSEADMANNDRATAVLKGLSDERERLAKIGKGATAQQAIEIEQRERFIQQAKKELEGSQNATAALEIATRAYDENAQKRKELADASQKQAEATAAAAKAEKEAENAAKKAATERLAIQQKLRDTRENFANQIADLAEVNRLATEGLAIEEARARVQLIRQGANAAELNALLEQQRVMENISNAQAINTSVNDGFAAEIIAEMKAADDAVNEFLNKDFGADLAAGFDKASQSLGTLVSVFDDLGKSQALYNQARIEVGGDVAKLAKIEAAQQANQLGLYADLSGAAKGLFKERTGGFAAVAKIEKSLRIAQLAHSAWEKKDEAIKLAVKLKGYAADLGLFLTSIPIKIAGFLGIGTAAGAAATAAAAIQPGPLAFVGFAAMAALIAGLGLSGRGGGGATSFSPSGNTAAGTGTVLGDPTAQSETLGKSIDKLKDIAQVELRFTSSTLSVLRKIEENTGGFDTSLAKLNVAIGAQIRNLSLPSGFSAASVASNPEAFSKQFFAALVGEKRTFANAQGAAVGDLFTTQVILPTIDGFKDIASLVGVAQADIDAALAATMITGGRFGGEDAGRNLNGLSSEDRAALISATASTLLDQLFGSLVGIAPNLAYFEDFQRAGEGIGETLIRVKSSVELADSYLSRLGLTAVDVSTVVRKQGDLTAELIRQSVLLQDETGDIIGGFGEMVSVFDGTGEELFDFVSQLNELQDALIATGKAGEYLTTFMIAGAGGVERLTDGLDSYFSDFLSPAEQAAELTRRMSAEFVKFGQQVPQSIDGFRDLVDGIDISTEAGQKLYGQVIALAPAFKDLQDALGETGFAAAIKDAEKALTDALSAMRAAVTQAESDLRTAYNAQANELKNTISQFDKFAESLRNFRESLAFTAAATSGGLLGASRTAFVSVANSAKLGDTDAMGSLPEIGRQFVQASADFSSSREDYLRDLAFAQRAAADAEAVAGRQKSITELQLEALTEEVGALIDIKDGTLEVRDAINNLKLLQTYENKAIADTTAAGFGALITSNQGTLTAIQAGTKASQDVQAAIGGLLDISARQEAASIAEAQAQQRAIEAEAAAQAERERLSQIATLQSQGAGAIQSFGETKSVIDAANEKLKTYINFGGGAFLSSGNFGSQSTVNQAQLSRGGLGESFGDVLGIDAYSHGSQAAREARAYQEISLNEYANGLSLAGVVNGGLNNDLVGAYNQASALRQQIIALGGVPAFAKGGDHEGGWRLVGENGPELEYTGPSRIYSSNQTSAMLSGDDTKAEINAMRAEMRQAMYAIAKNTGKTSDQLRQWNDAGRLSVRVDNDATDPVITSAVA